MVSTFKGCLAFGQTFEDMVSVYIRSRGWCTLPAYEPLANKFKGPRLSVPDSFGKKELIAPDMLAIRYNTKRQLLELRWFEAKHKNMATYSRRHKEWQTGIDRRCYEDYIQIQEITRIPVWLLFLQRPPTTKDPLLPDDAPPCPTGLYGCLITTPYNHMDAYQDENGSNRPMVYWNISDMKLLATLEEISLLDKIADYIS
jgi:hypothetical protein